MRRAARAAAAVLALFSLVGAVRAAAPCKLDWNRDGRVDLTDLFDGVRFRGYYWEWYVLTYQPSLYTYVFPNGNASAVDWNGDGRITVDDLLGTNPLGFYHHYVAYTDPRTRIAYVEAFPGAGCATPSGSVGDIVERDLVGRKTLLVLPISISRSSYAAIATTATAQAHGDQIAQALRQQSHGRLDMQAVATPVLDLPQPASYYVSGSGTQTVRLRADVIAMAARRGFDVAAYDYALVIAPPFWTATEGFAPAWKMAFTRRLNVSLSVHELGHTFGWAHAGRWDCSGASPLCSGGLLQSDGDYYDSMGQISALAARFCPWRQTRARWLDERSTLRVTRSGTWRLRSLDVDPATFGRNEYAALELRLDEVDSYWVYFRGYEPYAADGAMITRTTNAIRGQSILYDMTPGTPGTWQDARLAAGRTFTDPSAGISVTVLGISGSSLDVRVTVPPTIASIGEAPVVDVLAPTRHDTVRGVVTFRATAYAPGSGIRNGAGIRNVMLRLNGIPFEVSANLAQPPYVLVFDTRSAGIPDGQYRLFVEAEDQSGRKTQTIFPLFIDNSGPSL